MEPATMIGLDIAKHVFQVHGADAAGNVLFRSKPPGKATWRRMAG